MSHLVPLGANESTAKYAAYETPAVQQNDSRSHSVGTTATAANGNAETHDNKLQKLADLVKGITVFEGNSYEARVMEIIHPSGGHFNHYHTFVQSPNQTFVPVLKPELVSRYYDTAEDLVEEYDCKPRVITDDHEADFLKASTCSLLKLKYDSKNWRAIPIGVRVNLDDPSKKIRYEFDYNKHGFVLIGDYWVNAKVQKVVDRALELTQMCSAEKCILTNCTIM